MADIIDIKTIKRSRIGFLDATPLQLGGCLRYSKMANPAPENS